MRFPWIAYWPALASSAALMLLLAWQVEYCLRCQAAVAPPMERLPLMPVDILQGLSAPMTGVLEGQKRGPCKSAGARGLQEVELLQACWYPVQGQPPCVEGYEYGNRCYLPVPRPKSKIPTSSHAE